MNKLVATLVFTTFLSVYAEAQVSLNTVVQKYNAFKTALPGIRLHFVFNQEKYAPGDTVFFKAYFLKEDLHPVEGRQLINLSLVAPEGKVLQQYLFAVTNGVGANQIILPEILKPGIYNVAAYSSWMKNIESPKAFTKELIVVGETTVQKSQSIAEISPLHIAITSSDIRITSAKESLSRYNELYLLVINEGKIISSQRFTQGTDDVVSLSSNALLLGVNIIHVIDKLGRELSSTSHYIPEQDSVIADIKIRNAKLQTGRRAGATITIHDENNRPVEGEFSVRIFNGTVFDSTQLSFRRLLAQSAPTYEPWHQILYGKTKQRYNFTTSLMKKGMAYYADGTPLPPLTRLFFYLEHNDVMMQSLTMAGGRVQIAIPEINGNDILFYMAEVEGKEVPDIKIKWEDTTIPVPAPPASVETSEADIYGIFTANKRMIDQAFNFEEGDAVYVQTASVRNESALESRLKGADLTVHVDKFVVFNTMQEMVREIIPALNVVKSKGKLRVEMGLQRGVAASEPLYIIDGMATKDNKYFLSLKPSDLDRIKLMTNPAKLLALGLMGRSGVVIVETKAGNLRLATDVSNTVNGINRPIPFTRPASVDPDRPNFRSTIYWDPSVKTTSNGKAIVEFECSDDLGPVYIRVDGMTADGRPFSGEARLNVVLTVK